MSQTDNDIQSDVPDPSNQTEVIQFLEAGAGRGTKSIRIDTHGALIFLIGAQALKIKRAVKFNYMDLSTAKKRHDLLDREFELNKGTAPSIYHGVVPVVRKADGALALDGDGIPLEWVLVMNRFPPEAELTHIAKTRGIDDELAQQLGTSIAKYHATTPVQKLDGLKLIKEILSELETVFNQMGDVFDGTERGFIATSRAMWGKQAEVFHQRTLHQHIRRCHGDLHLRNIVMIEGVPTPFDALEFDERLGTCDTLYDLAFLLMDLDYLGMTHAANLVLNTYLHTADHDMSDAGLSLLPLYLSIRAAIRAMVDVQTSAVCENRDEMLGDARAYMAQALAYLAPKPPVLIAIGGYSGTGKTTIARAVAHLIGAVPGAIHIRSDVVRKTLLHRHPLDHLGPDGYAPEITKRTYEASRREVRDVLEQGHAAILDAVHSDPETRLAAEKVAKDAGFAFLGIWLESSTHTRLDRVATRGPDVSDADADVVKKQAGTDPGPMGWHRINADQPKEAVIQVVSALISTSAVVRKDTYGETSVG